MKQVPRPWKIVDDYTLTGYHFPVIVDADGYVVFAAHIWDHTNTINLIVDSVNKNQSDET